MNPNNSIMGGAPQASSQSVIPQAPAQGTQPNWWEKLLPDALGAAGSFIGGIGGGIAGVAGGAAIPGADLTGIPEVAGGMGGWKLGQSVGGAAGGALGKTIENYLTGQKDLGNGVGASAVENGIAPAVGGALIKGGGALVGGAKDLLSNAAAGRVAQTAAAVENAPWSGIANSAVARNSNMAGTLGKMGEYGIDTTPSNLATVAGQVSHPETGVLSDLINGGMAASTKPVNIDGTISLATNIAGSPQLAGEGAKVGEAFSNTVNNVLGLNGAGKASTAASDIYQARQTLMNKANANGISENLSNAYRDVANSLDGALSRSGVDSAVSTAGISPAQLQTLQSISPQLATEAQAAASKGVGALRSLAEPFDNAGNLAQAQIYHAGGQLPGTVAANAAQAAGKSGGGGLSDAIGYMAMPFTGGLSGAIPLAHTASKLVGNPGVQDTLLGGLTKATNSATANKVIPAMIRSGSILGANLPNDGGTPSPMGTASSAIPNNAGGAVQSQSPLQQAEQNAIANVQAQQAAQAMDQLYASNAPVALGGMANSAASEGANATSGLSNINTSLIPIANKQALLAPIIANNETSFNNAGGAQGLLGGGLSQLTAMIPGSAANNYQRNSEATAAALATALGIPIEQARGLVPHMMQNEASAGVNSANLNNILGNMGGAPSASAIPVAPR